MDQEYETMSPPGSPSGRSAGSSNLSARQYFCVNLSKFVIEITGTAIFTMFFYMLNGRYSSMLLSLWVLTLFGMNISGAHFNPCITLAQMVRKSSSFGRRRLLGIMYLVAQFLGAMLGALAIALLLKESGSRINVIPAAWGCEYKKWTYKREFEQEDGTTKVVDCRYNLEQGEDEDPLPNPNRVNKWFQSCVSETFGTFIFVLFFMICQDERLRYSSDNVKNALVISASYISAQLMAGGQYVTQRTGPCLNPATAFGLALFQGDFNFFQYILMPFLGFVCSVIFYEFVFVKTQEYLQDDSEEEEEDEEEDGDDISEEQSKLKGGNQSD